MLAAALKRLFNPTSAAPSMPSAPPAAPTKGTGAGSSQEALNQYFGQVAHAPVPSYPGRCAALVAASPEELLATQEEVIFRIRDNCALNEAQFDALVHPILLRYAAFVHLLPASESHHHCGPGGLLRHGLEVCAHAARMAEGQYVGGDLDQGHRLQYAPRWKVAAMLAGLLHDMGKPVVDLGATDESGEQSWSAQVESLWAWLQRHQLEHYYLYWRPGARHNRHLAMGVTVAREIIGQEMLSWLSEHRCGEVVDLLMVTLTETPELTNTMLALVKKADSASVEADLAEQARRMAGTGQGANQSLAARFIAAMRRRVECGVWRLNTEGCPLWWTDQGLVGIFPALVDDIVSDLRMDGTRSLPSNRDDWLRLLADYQHLEQAVGEGERRAILWDFLRLPPEGKKTLTAMVTVRAAKFARPELVVGSMPLPEPMAAKLTAPFKAEQLAAAGAGVEVVTPAGDPLAPAQGASEQPVPGAQEASTAPATTAVSGTAQPASTPETGIVEVEDRRQRVDAATERARQREADPGKGANYAELLQRLTDHSIHGAALAEILKAIEAQRLLYGADILLLDDALAIRFPEAFAAAGDVSTDGLPRFLTEQGWLRTQEGVERKSVDLTFPTGAKVKALVMGGLPYFAAKALQAEQGALMQFNPEAKPKARPERAARRQRPPLVQDPGTTAPTFKRGGEPPAHQEAPDEREQRLLSSGPSSPDELREILRSKSLSAGEKSAIAAFFWGVLRLHCNKRNLAHITDLGHAEAIEKIDAVCQRLNFNPEGVIKGMVGAEPPLWECQEPLPRLLSGLSVGGLRPDYTPPPYMADSGARRSAGSAAPPRGGAA